ncbi:MAG: response regulator [Candidatus Omnitrophica bacterium]|nr:response regulator [Candidatus Omnitrophota bacterium]MCM8827437.1 response regulator [Candidatus Omnitrophota bacterium]
MEEDKNLKSLINFLVVEDDEAVRQLIVRRLRMEDFSGSIYEASDGQEALKIFSEQEIDIIICDWRIPLLNGIDFVNRVRSTYNSSKVAIIMMSAETEMDKIELALNYGVDDYLTKPFTTQDFREKLKKAIEKIKGR